MKSNHLIRGGASLVLLLGLFLAGTLTVSAAVPEAATSDEECMDCHGDPDLTKEAEDGRVVSLFVESAVLRRSPHKKLACIECHAGISEGPHEEAVEKVKCEGCHKKVRAPLAKSVHVAGRRRGADAPTCVGCHGSHEMQAAEVFSDKGCEGCHREAVGQYRSSAHAGRRARGRMEAPTCQSCHGKGHSILSAAAAASPTYHLNLPRTCAKCHADPEVVKKANLRSSDIYKLYMDSIHGRALSKSGLLVAAACSDCHGNHDVRRHTDPAARVYRTNIPGTCGQCHAGVLTTYRESAHGQAVLEGNADAPVCSDCHTAHQIRRVETDPWKLQIIQECGTCHEESLQTYRDTFHGQVTTLGFTRVARCSDCHGSHSIFPPSDPRSTLSTGRIVSTCQQCHTGARPAFAKYYPHADYTDKEKYPILYYTYRSMTLLLWGVLGSFGLHTILWLPRSLRERMARHGRSPGPPPGAPLASDTSEEEADIHGGNDPSLPGEDAR